jgi:predicted Zn-dependent protease with MMP-like domain
MDLNTFEQFVLEALESLPQEFLDKMDNVDIVVEEWPTSEHLNRVGATPQTLLFGLYQGVPRPKRSGTFQLPDKITIFAGPIISVAPTEKAIKEKVMQVVKHEIAHHFGMGEAAIRRRGL